MINKVIVDFDYINELRSGMSDSERLDFYYHQNDADKIMLISTGKMKGLITSSMLIDLLNNDAINNMNCCILSDVPEDAFTLELATLAVTKVSVSFSYLPEFYKKMFTIQKAIVDKKSNPFYVMDDYILDLTIGYAIKKNGLYLGSIPKEKRTREYCETAVLENPKALRFVPNEYKTYEMCKKSVIRVPETLKYVPVQILTQEFIDELLFDGIVIPKKVTGYVKVCLETNSKKQNIENISLPKENVTENVVPDASQNITIDSLGDLFTINIIRLLNKYNVITLADLIKVVDNPTLCIEYFGNSRYYDEIVNTTRLLKCKYLDEDPMIDINDEEKASIEFLKSLGVRPNYRLLYYFENKSIKEVFALAKKEDITDKLMKINSVGKTIAQSTVNRVNIISDYYERHPEKIPSPVIDEELSSVSLEEVYAELKRLKEEKEKLDSQIEIVLRKIKKLEKRQGMGK